MAVLSKFDRDDYLADGASDGGYESEDGGVKLTLPKVAEHQDVKAFEDGQDSGGSDESSDNTSESTRDSDDAEYSDGETQSIPETDDIGAQLGQTKVEEQQFAEAENDVKVDQVVKAEKAEKACLMSLSIEVRAKILRELLVTRGVHEGFNPSTLIILMPLGDRSSLPKDPRLHYFWRWTCQGMTPNDLQPAIIHVCHSLYLESMEILYKENVFRVEGWNLMHRFSKIHGFDIVRTISIKTNYFHPLMPGLPPNCHTLILEGAPRRHCTKGCRGFHDETRACLFGVYALGYRSLMRKALGLMKQNGLQEIKFVDATDGSGPAHKDLQAFVRRHF